MICWSSRKEKRTCFQIIGPLEPLKKNNSCRGPVFCRPSRKKQQLAPKKFRKDGRRFLVDFVSTILSKVAACFPVGQGLSCFCPGIVIGSDDYSDFHLFGQLLESLFGLGWVRGQKLSLQNLSSTHSSESCDSWSWVAADHVCQLTTLLRSATNLASAFGRICTKLVSC